MNKLIKRPELLKESNRDFDFFDFKEHAKNLYNNFRHDTSPTVTVLVGGYGTGKSVLLNEVRKISCEAKTKDAPKWVFFECWQYPDKGDLWEALILELVEEVSGKKKRVKLTRAYSDIRTWRDSLSVFLSNIRSAIATVLGISIISWVVFSFADDAAKNTFLVLITAIFFVLLASFEFLTKPESKSNVSRLSDYKEELKTTLKEYKGIIYIVLEDIDRAGELGRQFFETVSHFVKDDMFKNKNIKIVVPVADIDRDDKKALYDSIDKASDNILHFNPSYRCEDFITEVFSGEFLDVATKQLLISTIGSVLGETINVRKMKHALRNAITKHKRLSTKDFQSHLAMCIAVEFSKYMRQEIGSTTIYSSLSHYNHKPLFDWATQENMLDKGESEADKDIEPRDYFQVSDETFADIRFTDSPTNSSRGYKPIYHRNYLISKAYFRDL